MRYLVAIFALLAFTLQAQVATSVTNGLVGWWTLNEGSGTVVNDSSGNANTGTLTNSTAWTNGVIGGAYRFRSVDDSACSLSDKTLVNGVSQISVSAWVNISRFDLSGMIVFFSSTDASSTLTRFSVGADITGAVRIGGRTNDSGGFLSYLGPVLKTNTWTHVAYAYSNNAVFVWTNSVLAGTGSLSLGTLKSSDSLRCSLGGIGADGPNNTTYGTIDDIRIYNRALSADEITRLYHEGVPWTQFYIGQTLGINQRVTGGGGGGDGADDPYVTNWVYRITQTGGSAPGTNEINLLNIFVRALRTNNIDTNIVAMIVPVSNNIAATLTPLIYTDGYSRWTNLGSPSGFSDLNVGQKGLMGNSRKMMDTGVVPGSTTKLTTTSGGLTVYYVTNNVTDSSADFGDASSASSSFILYGYGGVAYFDCWQSSGSGRINAANNFHGFVSGNRIANNDIKLYRANSGSAFASFASGGANAGSVPSGHRLGAMGLMNQNDSSAYIGAASCSTKCVGLMAVHSGMTTLQSSNFYVATQALMTGLGRQR